MSVAYTRSYDAGTMARKSMLRLARALKEEGHVYQAIDLLKQAMDDYPNSPESRLAVQEFVALGEYLESRGMTYTALSMYKWLKKLS